MFTSTAGLAVVGLLERGGGSDQLILAVFVSGAVGLLVSLWLDLILSHGVIRPVEALGSGLQQVQEGDLTVQIPVTASDELGELASAFNLMVRGLHERERMRAVFSTYMTRKSPGSSWQARFPRVASRSTSPSSSATSRASPRSPSTLNRLR